MILQKTFFKTFIILILFLYAYHAYANKLKPGDKILADFENPPYSNIGTVVGTYGANIGSGFTNRYAHSGKQSYKLVFSKDVPESEAEHFVDFEPSEKKMKELKTITTLKKRKKIDWAVFLLYMGPITDTETVPVTIRSEDLSGYKYLKFWVKGRGGEDFRIYFRDAKAGTYDPQVILKPRVVVNNKWKCVEVKLERIKSKIDLANIVQIGIGFGSKDGNRQGNVMYIDDFILAK